MCDELAIINHGRIIAHDTTENILAKIENKEVRFTLDRAVSKIPEGLDVFSAEIVGKKTVSLRYAPSEQSVGHFIDLIQKAGYSIDDVATDESDLEDVFLQMTKSA